MENIQKLLVVVTILILGFHGFGCFGCRKDELNALLQLKSAINNPNGIALADWKEEAMGRPSNCCDWEKVSCGMSGGVVELNLNNVRNIQGDWYVNASLFLPFPHLQKLYLTGNLITGWTHHLRHLSSLEELELDDNKLKGLIDLYDVEALQNLKLLSLSGNSVDGFERIHGSSRNTSKLESLYLSYIIFKDANTLLDSLSSFPSLKFLVLAENDFKGEIEITELSLYNTSITGWTQHLRKLSSLEVLILADNKLKGMIDLYDVEALQNLKYLDLSGNSVDGFKRIHGSPRNTSKLETLDLSNITFQDASTLLDSLLSFPSLKSLSLARNDFKGVIETTGWLCQLKKIQVLDIGYNDIHGQLPLCLRNLTSLQHLDIRLNNLHGRLPLFWANLTTLQYLDLSSNQFVGNVAESPLTKLTSLQTLSLSNNKFQIPQSFRSFVNHSSLKLLWLDGNDMIPDNAIHQPFVPKFQLSLLSLSNCKIRAPLPSFIHHQYNLTYLDLSHNYIEGSFLTWILENNTFLNTLGLANNFLTWSSHLSRYPHSHIKVLDVLYNNINYLSANLSQSFPNILYLNFSKNSIKVLSSSTFCDMKNLIWLDLSYNHLTGEMPKQWIKGCFSLLALFLSHNTLEVIPSLSNSTSLRCLRLNNNNFSGMIPLRLFSASLELFDLSGNHLGGQIPTEMCKLKYLLYMDLSNNSFFGFLPPCFYSPYLLYVYLYKNKLNGPLLPIFRNNTSLVTLDLGDNHLSGVIPEWIGNLRSLSILSLHNNHFEGHIPSQVCFLNQLTILDLSSNNISGQIPHCLSQLTFQPLEEKSIFEEYDIFLSTPDIGVDFNSIAIVARNFKAYFGRFLSIQNAMEITTKSHTYTYVEMDLDGMAEIDLACNKLSGQIPPEIGSMIGVRALNLSHNELTDLIPSTLSKLSQIESLHLSYNKLNGSIPLELIQLNALAVFSVAHNNLSGRTLEQKAQFGTFGENSYEGNPFLYGPSLLNDCSSSCPNLSRAQNEDDIDGSMDMDVFYICFIVSSVIMFLGTLIVLCINLHWRRVWFYYSEMWITWVYYFVVDIMRKAWKQAFKLG